jgi:hypothetical protein
MVKCCEPKRKGGRPVHRLSVSSKGVLTNLLYTWWKRMALLAQLSSQHQTGGKKTSPSIRNDWMPFEHAETPWTK